MANSLILPPGPKSRSPLGFLNQFGRQPIQLLQKAAPYGDIVSFRVVNRNVYLLNNPDYIQHVLVDNNRNYLKGRALSGTKPVLGQGLLTSEGDFHTRQRRMIQPAFHRQRIANYASIITAYADHQMQPWKVGATFDLHHEMMTLTMLIVAKCLFDADVSDQAGSVGEAMSTLLGEFSLIDSSPIGQLLAKLPSQRQKRRTNSIAALNKVVYKLIEDRRNDATDHGDLLSMLIETLDEEGDGKGMTNEQVRDEVMTLFLAGHETTANALSWTFYALTQYPEVETKLHAELASVLSGRTPTLADLPNLPYTRQVFSEAMRLYPPAWIMGRTAIGPDQIGGYTIPAGSTVVFSQYLMHRNPAYWDDPERFCPERFANEHDPNRPRYAYFPFGGGPRLCIGEPFAWMEGELLLASIAQHWRFGLAPKAVIEPEPSITLRLKHGLPVILSKV